MKKFKLPNSEFKVYSYIESVSNNFNLEVISQEINLSGCTIRHCLRNLDGYNILELVLNKNLTYDITCLINSEEDWQL